MKIPPIIKIVLGFFLFFGGLKFRTGYQLYDYLILIFSIIGFAIFLSGSRELRKNAQLNNKL